MNTKGMYRIYTEPVPLKKVFDGLWVTNEQPYVPTEEDYFKSVELFNKPLCKKKDKIQES